MTARPESMEAAITERRNATVPVHLVGQVARMPELVGTARRHNLVVVEDACLALGASICGRRAGQWAVAAAFSVNSGQHVGALASTGAVVLANGTAKDRILEPAGCGKFRSPEPPQPTESNSIEAAGLNESMDEFQALLLGNQLVSTDARILPRLGVADQFRRNVPGRDASFPSTLAGHQHECWNVTVRSPERNAAWTFRKEYIIESTVPCVPLIRLQPSMRFVGSERVAFSKAEGVAQYTVGLSNTPELPDPQTNHVVEVMRTFDSRRS